MRQASAGGPGPPAPPPAHTRPSSGVPFYPWAFYAQTHKDGSLAPPAGPSNPLASLSAPPPPLHQSSRFADSRAPKYALPPSTHAHLNSSSSGPLTSAPTTPVMLSAAAALSPVALARQKRFVEFSDFGAADKDTHTTKEKRRRQSVNAHYSDLRALLPPISENKAAVLHHALDHVKRMSQSCSALIEQNNMLAERNQQLQAQILELQELLCKSPQSQAQAIASAVPSGSAAASTTSSAVTTARTSPSAASPYAPAPSNDAERGRRREGSVS